MTVPPGGSTRVAAVVGSPIAHSLSPAIHNAAFAASGLDWVFVALEAGAGSGGSVVAAVRELGVAGVSVTMPLKDEVAVAADERSPVVERLGAANCLLPAGRGRVRAENTDGAGFLASLTEAGFDPAGSTVAVLGAGGAARAVVLALAEAGANGVVVVNRSEERAARTAALATVARVGGAEECRGAALVVNATSVGMGSSEVPVDPALLGAGQVVVDLVYDPVETAMLAAARSAGATTVDGVGMLVHQAAHAFTLWTGEAAPVAAMAAAVRDELAARSTNRSSNS